MPDYILKQTGDQVQDAIDRGLDLHEMEEGAIPKKGSTDMEASAMSEDDDAVVSEKSIEVPPNTLYVSENLGLKGSGEAFGVFDRASDRMGFLVAYEELINSRPFYRNLDSADNGVVIQNVKSANSPTQDTSDSFTLNKNRLITALYLESPADTTGASVTLKRGGYIVSEVKDLSFTADTELGIEIEQGVFFPSGAVLEIEIKGVTVKGKQVSNNFSPYLKLDSFEFTKKQLATLDDIISSGAMTWPQIVQAATDDTTGTKLDASHIDNLPNKVAMTGAEIVQAIDGDGTTPKVPFKNLDDVAPSSLAATVGENTTQVAANKSEIERIKTDTSGSRLPIFSWYDKGVPTLPTDQQKAYYIHIRVLPDSAQAIQIPQNTPEDCIFSIENNDRDDYVTIRAASGETINGANSYQAQPDTLSLFVKSGTNYDLAYGGVFPNSMTSMKTTIESLLTGQLHTIDDIQAQLKDHLHTFNEIQQKFSDRLFTRADGLPNAQEIISALESDPGNPQIPAAIISDLEEVRKYTITNGIAVQIDTDATIVMLDYDGASNVTQTLQNLINVREGSLLAVHVHASGDNSPVITLLPSNSGQTVEGVSSYDIDVDTWALFTADKKANNWVELANINTSGGGTGGSGIEIDDGTSDAASITKLNIKGAKITELPNQGGMGASEIEVTSGLDIHMKAPDQQYGNALCSELIIEKPLETDDTPAGENVARLYIQHDAFEPMHKPSFLAYLAETEEVVGKMLQGFENTADSHHKGALWFDDIVVPEGTYIELRKADKAYGIQEADELDPNVTGGTDYLIAARIHMKGNAPSDGFARLYLYNHSIDPFNPTGYLLDKNGQPMAVERHYKNGQELGILDIIGVVNAKGLQEFTVHVVDSFTNDIIQLTDRTEGATGLMIQAITSEEKTGHGLLQFESDTSQNIEFSSHYLGVDRMSLDWINSRPEAPVAYTAGTNFISSDGWRLINLNGIKVGVVDGHTHIQDDGTHIVDFNYGKVFSAEETQMLRNKDIHVTVTLVDKDAAFRVALMKWTGKPDEYTPEIFTTRAITPSWQTNWAQADSLFISEDVVVGDHTLSKVMTVPSDANNYAIIIYPVSAEMPMTMKLKQLKVDVSPAFVGYALKAPELLNEIHLLESDEHKEFIQDKQGYASLRYTINVAADGLPMPAGIPQKGAADITLDTTVNQVSGSAARGGEGAIKFENDGRAKITTELRLWNEQGTDNSVKFWWAKVSPDGSTFTKLDDSEFTFVVPANGKNTLHLFVYSHDFEAGDRIALRASTDKADGAFLQCVDDSKPMVDVTITYTKLIADSGDDPTTGVDISAFSKYFPTREAVSYIFVEQSQFTIDVTIPDGVEMAVLGTFSQDVDGTIRPIKSPDYRYIPPASPELVGQLVFDLGRKYTGEIILEFLA